MDTIAPYGGRLFDLVATGAERDELLACVPVLPSLQLSARAVHDLELASPIENARRAETLLLERGLLPK